MQNKKNSVKVVKVDNLLRPDLRKFKTYDIIDPSMTVADAVSEFEAQLRSNGYNDFVITKNGYLVKDPKTEIVEDGDLICISIKHGFITAVGFIWIALMQAGMYGMALHIAAYVIGTALFIGAGIVLKTFMGQPKTPDNKTAGADSPTYGFGATNPTTAGYPVPVVYGYTSTTPPVIASYRTVDDDYSMWQYMLFACCSGITDVYITKDRVMVGDEYLTKLNNYAFGVTSGSNDPVISELDFFNATRHDRSFSKILTNSPSYIFTLDTLGDCDTVNIIVEFANGLFSMTDDGSMAAKTVELEAYYSTIGGSPTAKVAAVGTITLTNVPSDGETITVDTYTWTFRNSVSVPATEILIGTLSETLTAIATAIETYSSVTSAAEGDGDTVVVTADTVGAAGNSIVFSETASNLTMDGSGYLGGTTAGSDGSYYTWTATEDTTAAVRCEWTITFPSRGKYTVCVRRVTADDPTSDSKQRSTVALIAFIESLTIRQSHPGIQCVALGVKATDNISGQIPTISIIQERTTLAVPDWGNVGTMNVNPSNPAYAAYAAMTDTITGRKISPLNINQTAWEEWAAWCDGIVDGGTTKRCQFNGVFDEKGNFGDNCLSYIEEVGRAKILQYGDQWTVVVDKPKTSSYTFSAGNILKGSFSWESYEDQEKVDAIEIVYWDKDRNFKKNSVIAKATWYETLTTQPKTASIELRGCNNKDQATRESIFRMQKTEMLTRHGVLEVSLGGGVFCERGDVVDIIHPTNKYGFGGRLTRDRSNATSIYLDQEVTLSTADYSGKAKLFLIDPDGTRYEIDITGPWDTATQYINIDTPYTGYRFDTYAIGRPNDEKLLYQIVNKTMTPSESEVMEKIKIEFVEYNDDIFYHVSWGVTPI